MYKIAIKVMYRDMDVSQTRNHNHLNILILGCKLPATVNTVCLTYMDHGTRTGNV